MPLKKGKSQKTVSANIRTLVDDYSKSGRIGTSKPANKKAAVKQAVAIALRQAGKPKKFAAGGSINDPYNFLVEPGVTYEQQFAEDMKAKARAAAKENASPTSASQQQQQQQRRTPQYLPLPSQAGQVEDQFPKFKQTRMHMRFTPEAVDVSKPPSKMRRGGKVSSKKGPKK